MGAAERLTVPAGGAVVVDDVGIVVGVADEEWGEVVSAIVVRNGECSAEELIEFARVHLSGPKTPKVVIFVDELPKTGSGKVLKRKLRDRVDLHIQSEV